MADEKYWVVEARLPIQINDADTAEEAARKAAKQIEFQHGISISNWFLRVFEYGGEKDEVGVVREWFSNPAGTKFRDIEGNVEVHQSLYEEGKTPSDD